MTKSGFIALLGRPNVGKSTLLNRMVGQKISIVTPKPQTTRNRVTGIKTLQETQMIFMDTPGIYRGKFELCQYMRSQAFKALKGVDLAIFITDRTGATCEDDRFILSRIAERQVPAFFVLNKVDQMSREAILTTVDQFRREFEFQAFFPVCALKNGSTEALEREIIAALPEGPFYFPEDATSEQPEEFFIAELVREKVFQLTTQEIPYSVAVTVEKIEERENGMLVVFATVFVEKESQKGILIGKGGRLLKKTGTRARQDMEQILGVKVYLDLRVRVKRNWSRSPRSLKDLGYE